MAVAQAWARCSSSTPMARVIQPCTVFRKSPALILILPTATERIQLADYFCLATRCMEPREMAVARPMERCLPSRPMEPVLRHYIDFRQSLVLILLIPTATELI